MLRELAFSALPNRRRLIAAALLDRRGREGLLEVLLVVVIVGIVVLAAARSLSPLLTKLHVLDVAFLFTTERTDAVSASAGSGRLPGAGDVPRREGFSFYNGDFEWPEWRDGELVYTASAEFRRRLIAAIGEAAAPDYAVAFRVARAPVSGATVWLCGTAEAPAGFEAPPPLHTTIPARYLPHFCR